MPNFADGIQYINSSGIGSYVDAGVLISSGDLNTFYGVNYWGKQFYAVGGNTLTNTPVTGQGFSLEILRAGDQTTVQRIINITSISGASVPVVWVRSATLTGEEDTSPVWSAWTEVAEANGTYPDMTVGNATNATHATSADSATNATNAANATKATQDGNGKVIASTYATQSGNYSSLTAGDLFWKGESMEPTLSNGIIKINMPSATGIYLVTVYCTFTVSSQEYAYVCYGSTLLSVQIFGVGMTLLPVYDGDGLVGFLGLSDYVKHQSPGLAFYNLSLQKQTILSVVTSAVTQQALTLE